MPRRIDPQVKGRAVRLVREHQADYPSTTAAAAAVARQLGLGRETVRRWVVQAHVDEGHREGVSSEEREQIRKLKAENARLREEVAILSAAATFFAGALRPPQPLIMGFIDTMRAEGHALESTCRVLREQGWRVAARTYRAWKSPTRVIAARTHSDAVVIEAIHAVCTTTGPHGHVKATPESLYGRRKMTALLRRSGQPDVARCTVDRAMKTLGMKGVQRAKGVRTTIPRKADTRAGDLLQRDFTTVAPNRVWVADFTVVRTWAGWLYVAFILDVFSQRIVAWHAMTSKVTDLVLIPLRIALWDRDRHGHRVIPGELIHHHDAGSQYTSIRFTEHLALEGIAPSIGTVGDALDNGLMEGVIGLYKTECIRTTIFHDGPYRTIADVEYATAGYIDWYNQRSLHGSLGMAPPVEFEQTHYAALTREPQPT